MGGQWVQGKEGKKRERERYSRQAVTAGARLDCRISVLLLLLFPLLSSGHPSIWTLRKGSLLPSHWPPSISPASLSSPVSLSLATNKLDCLQKNFLKDVKHDSSFPFTANFLKGVIFILCLFFPMTHPLIP